MVSNTIVMSYTFEQLPEAVTQLHEKLENIERLLLESYQKPENGSELLTIQQAAELLNLSISTLYAKVSRKQIPVSKKGKRLYFSKAELIAWIKSGKQLTETDILNETQNRLSRIPPKRRGS